MGYDFKHWSCGGGVLALTAEHHDKNRQTSLDTKENEKLPKHDNFTVMRKDKVLGELQGAATFAREVRFVIEDDKLRNQFYREIVREQKKHHYGPEF